MELAYMYVDFEWYGVDYPYCFSEEEAIKMWKSECRDRGLLPVEFPFDEMFRLASQEEIEEYGYGF